MTDKELLELAAKANGANGEYVDNTPIDGAYRTGFYDRLTERCWNPLTDDGDALRLVVRLGIELRFTDFDVSARAKDEDTWHGSMRLEDKPRAVRYVITKAAAEIGKNL